MSLQNKCNCEQSCSVVAFYNVATNTFEYPQSFVDYFGENIKGKLLWDFMFETGLIDGEQIQKMGMMVGQLNDKNNVMFGQALLSKMGWHRFGFVYNKGVISVTVTPMDSPRKSNSAMCDELTGLLSRHGFCAEVDQIITANPNGDYAVMFFDIIKFKAINEIFGFDEGDRVLMHIASVLKKGADGILTCGRDSSDRFAFLADTSKQTPQQIINKVLAKIQNINLPFEINCNVGVYLVTDAKESGNSMLDKAVLAQSAIKGSYTQKVNYYTEKLWNEMLGEQEITGMMQIALENDQFVVYYQPQYNHSTGMIIGAEALVRWQHPQKGIISPGIFIPIFEKNGFITEMDCYVFEQVCKFLRRSLDNNFSIVPISVNITKHDIYSPNFISRMEQIRKQYNVPAKYLRLEITESVLIGNTKFVNEVIKKLHDCGYIIEMDDFGSGYSSLNVLKDLDFDIIKLDMLFLADQQTNSRGGTILSSIITMAKWLRVPVIAEGVETVEQADFLKSIGCNFIQGYLYSKPIPAIEYEKLISASTIGALIPQMDLLPTFNAANFWDPKSQETLIFSNFVGGAAIFNYDRINKKFEILRVNTKYLRELGMNLSEQEIITGAIEASLDEENHQIIVDTLERAISSADEEECETWRNIKSPCCGEELICVRSTMRLIGQSDDKCLFYSTIRNVTAEKQQRASWNFDEKLFKMMSEQVNVYFWEYTIATREMRPCFRCQRDLGFPPLLRNYPEPAIENGTFPPEVAEMYRDWHVQIANGVKELEAIIPLTPDRIPFRVKYTTEFDENGHAIKAYGSARLIVPEV